MRNGMFSRNSGIKWPLRMPTTPNAAPTAAMENATGNPAINAITSDANIAGASTSVRTSVCLDQATAMDRTMNQSAQCRHAANRFRDSLHSEQQEPDGNKALDDPRGHVADALAGRSRFSRQDRGDERRRGDPHH